MLLEPISQDAQNSESCCLSAESDSILPASPFDRPGDWFVLHTRSRQEKALALDLSAKKIACFLPLQRVIRYHGKRKCIVEAPLFSNYLFIRGFAEDTYIADRTKKVANIIRCPDQQTIQSELYNINLALLQGAPLGMYNHFTKGIRVEVRAGPFRGIQGIIEDRINSRTRGYRLILNVETLGRAVSFEVDSSLVDVIE